jgi:hypothetical protein
LEKKLNFLTQNGPPKGISIYIRRLTENPYSCYGRLISLLAGGNTVFNSPEKTEEKQTWANLNPLDPATPSGRPKKFLNRATLPTQALLNGEAEVLDPEGGGIVQRRPSGGAAALSGPALTSPEELAH